MLKTIILSMGTPLIKNSLSKVNAVYMISTDKQNMASVLPWMALWICFMHMYATL